MIPAPDQKIITAKNKVIVALDFETAKEAKNVMLELKDTVGAFKIGLQLYTSEGPAFIRELTKQDIKIFLDLKFHDIPNTVAKASVEAARLGVWLFNIHALGGSEMMRRTIDEVREVCEKETLRRPKIIGVTVLTSANKAALHDVGIWNEPHNQALKLAKLAAESGLDGVVASAQEAAAIRGETGKDFMIVTPGIRPASAAPDDQKRFTTPREAVQAGADYLVIGRPITKAPDMIEAVHKIIAEIES
jgi:orotidine-5'-phosphate decarboxylase